MVIERSSLCASLSPSAISTPAISTTALAIFAAIPAAQTPHFPNPPIPLHREGPYRVLDNVEGDHIDIGIHPIKPMVVSTDHLTLWALNSHNSRVVGFSDLSGTPTKVFDVPWGPVSMEYWTSPLDSHEELLVVTQGTHGLVRLDPLEGTIIGYIQLPDEPGGTHLEGNQLFIACSAEDVVVQVDLVAGVIHDVFEGIDTTRHLLCLSGDGLGNVLVTPMTSGNNTMPGGGGIRADRDGTVLDLYDTDVADMGLPDEDVFRLIPGASPNSGTVEVVATGVGSQLFGHALNPSDGKLWVLNTEAMNADEVLDTEPEVRGIFAANRVTVVDLPALGGMPSGIDDHTFHDLDTTPATPIGKPYALSFSSTGDAFVIGTQTDNVTLVTQNGNAPAQLALPDGAIPRGIIYDETLNLIYVYCWGNNTIQVHNLGPMAWPLIGTLDLGYDPTGPARKRGREIFFDAHNSLNQSLSCESCHVEGMTDHLVWNLSNGHIDDKGTMLTQNLRGIEFTKPYHWRGERELVDFNPAFDGLLGGAELTSRQFEDFEAYVFGLQNMANPFQHPRRIVTDDRKFTQFDFQTHPKLSAVNGQDLYFDLATVGPASCNDCHQLPTGTNNDFFQDEANDTGHRNVMAVPAYNGIWRKEMKSRAMVELVGEDPEPQPPLGAGTTHVGLVNGLFEFVTDIIRQVPRRDREDIAHFLHQIDQGLAPAVHRARHVSQANSNRKWVLNYFMPQVEQRNADAVIIGRIELVDQLEDLRWYYNRDTGLFVADRGALPPRPITFFLNRAEAGNASLIVMGVPVGMGKRFGVDQDADDLFNLDEITQMTDPRDPDSDDDGFLDGTEVRLGTDPNDDTVVPIGAFPPQIESVRTMFVQARSAKLYVETNMPTKIEVNYSSNLGDSGTFVGDDAFRNLWEVSLRDLLPSNAGAMIDRNYTGTISVTNEFTTTTTIDLPPFTAAPFTAAGEAATPTEALVRRFEAISVAPSGLGGYEFTFEAQIEDRKLDAPAPLADHVCIAKVVRQDGVIESNLLVNEGPPAPSILSEFNQSTLYAGFGGFGPFIVGSISAGDGISHLQFRLPGAVAGEVYTVTVEVLGKPVDNGTFDPTLPFLSNTSLFVFPESPKEARDSGEITLF